MRPTLNEGTGHYPEPVMVDVSRASRVSGPTTGSVHTTRWRPPASAVVVTAYVSLTLLLFAPVLPHLATRLLGGPDGFLFAWWIKEVPYSLFHGHDPLLSNLILNPGPVNGMWNTSVPLPSLLMAPVTFTAGPIASVNLLLILAPALSATAGYWMARRFEAKVVGAAVCGLLYGFGPYAMGASLGHIHVALAWFPPVVAVLMRRILIVQDGSAVRDGAVLGIAAVAQLLCGEEVLVSTLILTAIATVVLAIVHHQALAEKWPYAKTALAVASVVGAALAAIPLGVQLLGANRATVPLVRKDVYVTDLATFVSPTRAMRFDPLGLAHLGAHATGNLAEDGGYLGVPLTIAFLAVLIARRRDPIVRFISIMAVIAALLSLGNELHVGGQRTHIPLPSAVFTHLPALGSLEPSRLSLFVMLFVALIVGRGLSELPATVGYRATGLAAVAVTALFLWPHPPVAPTTPSPPTFFSTHLVKVIPASTPVVLGPAPDPATPQGMLWQADANERFRIMSGYAAPWGDDYPSDPADQLLVSLQLHRPIPPSVTPDTIRTELNRLHIGAVVLTPQQSNLDDAITMFTAAIGRTPQATGGVLIWLLSGPGGRAAQ